MNKQAKIKALEARIAAFESRLTGQIKAGARRGIKDKTIHAPVIKMIEDGDFLRDVWNQGIEMWSRGDGYHDNRRPGRGGYLAFTVGPDGPNIDDIGLKFQDSLSGTVDWDPAPGGKIDLSYSSDWNGNDNRRFKLTELRKMEGWIQSRIEKDFDSYQDAYEKALNKFDAEAARIEAEEDFERSHRWIQGSLRGSKVARKGITVDWRGSFSIKDIPQDPYGQVYDAAILVDKRKTVQKAMRYVWDKHERKITKMKNVWEAVKFISEEIVGLTGKYPDWHNYSMPD